VPEGEVFPAADEGASFSAFGGGAGGFRLGGALVRGVRMGFGVVWGRKGGRTGVKGGVAKDGVGSRVDSADAPVSPLRSAPSPLDLRR